jgi:ribosome-associated protein
VAEDLLINERITIPAAEISLTATRASGPGGQHVNTADTRIQLRWNLRETAALTPRDRELALLRLAARLTKDGDLVLECDQHRSQRRNRTECRRRLADLLREALHRPPPRKKTQPSAAARARRLVEKKKRGVVKKMRREPDASD